MAAENDTNCIFCKIARGEIQSPKLFENERFFCIKDIRPQAPVHFLVIPKAHVESLDTAFPAQGDQQWQLLGELFEVGTRVAREQKLLPSGFRSVINTGKDGGQTVFHLHLHILGGTSLDEEM